MRSEPAGPRAPMRPDPAAPLPETVREGHALFTERAVTWATVLGGPIAGGYLMARNFRAFGEDRSARLVLVGAVAMVVVVLVTLALLPSGVADHWVLRYVVPGVWAALAFGLMEAHQKERVQAHVEAGGATGAFGWAVAAIVGGLVAAAVLVATVVLASAVFMFEAPFDGDHIEVGQRGGEVYFSGTATEADARAAGDLLLMIGYFSEPGAVANVVGDERGVDLWLALDPSVLDAPSLPDEARAIAAELEAVGGRPVQVSVVVDGLGGRTVDVLHGFGDPPPPAPPPPPFEAQPREGTSV